MQLDLGSVGGGRQESKILEAHFMGHGEEFMVVVEEGQKMEKEESRFSLKNLA